MVILDDNLLNKLQEVEGVIYKEIEWVNGDIYGIGGLNRYYINREVDGELRFETLRPNEVVFSAFHSSVEGIKKAEKAGFTIFD